MTSTAGGALTDAQLVLLWDLCHAPRLADHLDRRTVTALLERKLVTRRRGWIFPSAEARTVVHTHLRDLARSAGGRDSAAYTALANLAALVATDAEVRVGAFPSAVQDVLIALYRLIRNGARK